MFGELTKQVSITIDGQDYLVGADQTILQAARENDIFIPTLCELEGLSIVSICRICMVEVEGQPKLAPSCSTPVRHGMTVHTDTERLKRFRRGILELVFAEGNHICSVCVSNNNCELQNLAYQMGMEHVHFPHADHIITVDMSHPRFVLDYNRCILCTRCVRVCEEIENAHVLKVVKRGPETRIAATITGVWGDSETCTQCGKCVNVCPTGALSMKNKGVGEMVKVKDFLPHITRAREEMRS